MLHLNNTPWSYIWVFSEYRFLRDGLWLKVLYLFFWRLRFWGLCGWCFLLFWRWYFFFGWCWRLLFWGLWFWRLLNLSFHFFWGIWYFRSRWLWWVLFCSDWLGFWRHFFWCDRLWNELPFWLNWFRFRWLILNSLYFLFRGLFLLIFMNLFWRCFIFRWFTNFNFILGRHWFWWLSWRGFKFRLRLSNYFLCRPWWLFLRHRSRWWLGGFFLLRKSRWRKLWRLLPLYWPWWSRLCRFPLARLRILLQWRWLNSQLDLLSWQYLLNIDFFHGCCLLFDRGKYI